MSGLRHLPAPWMGPALAFAFVAAILALLSPALRTMSELWLDTNAENYTGGFLIAGISLWLLWRARAQFARDDARPGRVLRGLAAAALLVLVMFWQISYRAGIQLGYLMALPAIVLVAIFAARGLVAARAALVPLGYLVFALPIWDFVMPLLQWITIHAVRFCLRATDVPAYFQDSLVQLPSGVFEIQGGCGGLHYLIVALAIAALLGQLRSDPWRTRLRWLLVATAFALLSNWVRVYTVILAGHLTHMQSYLVRVSHYSYGWAVFMLAMAAFFLIVRRWAPPVDPRPAPPVPHDGSGPPAAWSWTALCLALVALPALANHVIGARLVADRAALERVERLSAKGAWEPQSAPSAWQPRLAHPDREARRAFAAESQRVELYVAVFDEQRQRKKFGGVATHPEGEATVVARDRVDAAGSRFTALLARETDGTHARLWVRYEVDGRVFAGATRAQIWYSLRTLATLESPASRLWILRAPCAADCARADAALRTFVENYGVDLWPASP